MYNGFRAQIFKHYNKARDYFIKNSAQLMEIECFVTKVVNDTIQRNYAECKRDYDEANYMQPFWANYPPDDRGRAPVGDQVPWIEVGEHAIGHKLCRLISNNYNISEKGLPSGADNRFTISSPQIAKICKGYTDTAFVFLDIKSVGPRDDFNHTVISPYQVSGDGCWDNISDNMTNSTMLAQGKQVSHPFYPAIAPVYVFSSKTIAPTIHLFVKPIYEMLNMQGTGLSGQPLKSIKNICVPNGLLLTKSPNYLAKFQGLFFPGKDDKGKSAMKVRCRVSFEILHKIADWRVQEFK